MIGLDLEIDPVAAGYVSSLARPGGRITGVFRDFPEFSTKWLELLRTVVPKLSQVAVLWDPSTGTLQKDALTREPRPLGVTLHVFEVNSVEALRGAFAASRAGNAEGAVLLSSPIFGSNATISAELAFEYNFRPRPCSRSSPTASACSPMARSSSSSIARPAPWSARS